MFQIGLSWLEWISDPLNKTLFESDKTEALKKFKRDEEEYIHQLLLQEQLRQQELQLQFQQQTVENIMDVVENTILNYLVESQRDFIVSPGIGTQGAAGIGSSTSAAGGFAFNTGIGNFVIGTFLDGDRNHTNVLADEGFERFTVR